MLLGLSFSEWGAIMLVVGFVLYFLHIFKRLRAWLAFIGTCLVSGGVFTQIITKAAVWLSGLTSSLVGKIFGVGVPGALFAILVIVFIHDLHPKGGGASKRTFWLGIAVAACLVAGVSAFAQLNGIPGGLRSGVSSVGG
jgi:hypothetical protein